MKKYLPFVRSEILYKIKKPGSLQLNPGKQMTLGQMSIKTTNL